MSQHQIVHVEFPATDQSAAGGFYSQVFGWGAQHLPEMNYTMMDTGGGSGAGLPQVDGEGTKVGQVIVYISTPDIEGSLATIESNGGKTLFPKTEIPGMGWFALFADPTGNTVGLFTDN